MSIETAVIPVAGAGTRCFPGTTSIEKCMLPVYAGDETVPLIDFMVEDCAAAGLKRVIFVTTPRGKDQLNDYYGHDLPADLEARMQRVGKTKNITAEQARRRGYGLAFEYVIQPPDEYGTSVPPHLARTALRGEKQFALMGGDDFVYHHDGTSELALAIQGWQESGADHAIMGLPVLRTEARKYGVLQSIQHADSKRYLTHIDEKPEDMARVPQHPVVNISRYLLTDTIWPFIEAEMNLDRGQGEHYVTYPIEAAVKAGQQFYVHAVQGEYIDGGSPAGLRGASNYITAHPRHLAR